MFVAKCFKVTILPNLSNWFYLSFSEYFQAEFAWFYSILRMLNSPKFVILFNALAKVFFYLPEEKAHILRLFVYHFC